MDLRRPFGTGIIGESGNLPIRQLEVKYITSFGKSVRDARPVGLTGAAEANEIHPVVRIY